MTVTLAAIARHRGIVRKGTTAIRLDSTAKKEAQKIIEEFWTQKSFGSGRPSR